MPRCSKARAIILHGARGGPDTNWFPWLDAALKRRGLDVLRPRFPTPKDQSLEAWLRVYDAATETRFPLPTILIGHSLGVAFALRLAERAIVPFTGLVLAAGFVGELGLPDYDKINASFFAQSFDWATIRNRSGEFCHCWAGNDDPYVPLSRTKDLADHLHVNLKVVSGGGHLNDEAGFRKFIQLRDALLASCVGASLVDERIDNSVARQVPA